MRPRSPRRARARRLNPAAAALRGRAVLASLLYLGAAYGIAGAVVGAPRSLEIELDGRILQATGVTPGGVLAIIGAARQPIEPHRGSSVARASQKPLAIERVTLVQDSASDGDRDGRVTVELERPLERGVVAAVDVSTGRHAALAVGTASHGLEASVGIDPMTGTLTLGLQRALVMWLRPGHGAWLANVQDGAPGDLARNRLRTVRWQLAALAPWPLDASQPKSALTRIDRVDSSDRLVVVDLASLTAGFFGLKPMEDAP